MGITSHAQEFCLEAYLGKVSFCAAPTVVLFPKYLLLADNLYVLKVLHSGFQPINSFESSFQPHSACLYDKHSANLSSLLRNTSETSCPRPPCLLLNIHFSFTASTAVLPRRPNISLPPASVLLTPMTNRLFIPHPINSACFPMYHISQSPSIFIPSCFDENSSSCAISFCTFPRLVLQRVLQGKEVTQLSSLHGTEMRSRAAVSFCFSFFFSFLPSFKNECSVV